jgi:hypothetical protein
MAPRLVRGGSLAWELNNILSISPPGGQTAGIYLSSVQARKQIGYNGHQLLGRQQSVVQYMREADDPLTVNGLKLCC